MTQHFWRPGCIPSCLTRRSRLPQSALPSGRGGGLGRPLFWGKGRSCRNKVLLQLAPPSPTLLDDWRNFFPRLLQSGSECASRAPDPATLRRARSSSLALHRKFYLPSLRRSNSVTASTLRTLTA